MKYLALYFSAPTISWGTSSKFDTKSTDEYPSKSAIIGMICTALGKSGEQIEFLKLLNEEINFNVYCFSDIHYMTDFQTIGCGYDRNTYWERQMIPHKMDNKDSKPQLINKEYLVGQKYGIIISSENEDLINEIGNGFKHPIWPIFFGRKCNIPDSRIFKGYYSSENDALNIFKEKYNLEPKFLITEQAINNANYFYKNDVPVQFGKNKIYKRRLIYKKYF